MAGSSSLTIRRDIQTLFDVGTAHGLSDQQLLERFVDRRDAAADAAFEMLVLRHGPMVLRLCHNVLSDPNDAQDAFQATFLVLVRRSGSLNRLESLGGWLYGVAQRVAARVRVEAARRGAVEGRAALRVVGAVAPAAGDEAEREELGPIVQEEVGRLPARYRSVVLLCYWEGLTQEQAAVRLDCPLGTVRSRLARARALLERRLARRGLAPRLNSSTVFASVLTRFAVPPELVQSTIRAGSYVASSQRMSQVVSGVVARSAQRVLWSMSMIKITSVATAIVLIGLAGFGVGLAGQKSRQGPTEKRAGQPEGLETAPTGQHTRPRADNDTTGAIGNVGGNVARFEAIYSNVQGRTTLIRVVPDGSVVKKGEIVGQLDSAALRDALINQKITTAAAKAIFQNATLAREDTDSALKSYRADLAPREQRELEEETKVAKLELTVAEEELKTAKSVGGKTELALKQSELAVVRARLAQQKAENRLHIFTQYTKDRTIKELALKRETAHSIELAKGATWELETSKEKKLEKQIAACILVAPVDGTVVHANTLGQDSPTENRLRRSHIEEGAEVRERQLILRIVPTPRIDARDR
jgi:HlyD family secretion protein